MPTIIYGTIEIIMSELLNKIGYGYEVCLSESDTADGPGRVIWGCYIPNDSNWLGVWLSRFQ